ncbi:hypothetical protein EG329_009550 [Mollisiaceae sp. DMI_Dod_QoI]|nr:hypothetical protein EG329_009550 [Helotiales sp. DMI_Dod_QoI]
MSEPSAASAVAEAANLVTNSKASNSSAMTITPPMILVLEPNLLCASAKFFGSALNGPFIEGQQGSIYLAEDPPGAFSIFLDWLYRRAIRTGNSETHLHDLFDLYIFSEKTCDDELKDKTMDVIQDMASTLDLQLEIVRSDLLDKVIKHLPARVRGLKDFCARLMAYTYYLRGGEDPDTDDEDSGNEDDNFDEEYSKAHMLKKIDLRHIWTITKDDFTFFQQVQDQILIHAQIFQEGKELPDPRVRDEEYKTYRCWFHCHQKDVDCRTSQKKQDLKFVPRDCNTTQRMDG